MRRRLIQLHSLWQNPLLRPSIRQLATFKPPSEIDYNLDYNISPDADEEKRKKILLLEMDTIRREGGRVPNPKLIPQRHWDELLKLDIFWQRVKYYRYLQNNQYLTKKKLLLKEQKRLEKKSNLPLEPEGHINFRRGSNTIFMLINNQMIDRPKNERLFNAMLFGQKLVVDCSYNEYMTLADAHSCARQIMDTFSANRSALDPFDVHFVNVDFDSELFRMLERRKLKLHDPAFPINLHTCSYTDLFPREQLVYLTPHCRNDLERYDPDDIYIIGAMVDKKNRDPLSLAKAKKDGLRVARLPLDRHLQLGKCRPDLLTVYNVFQILLDLKDTGDDWKKALRHVPRRKLAEYQKERARKSRDSDEAEGLDNFEYRFNPRVARRRIEDTEGADKLSEMIKERWKKWN